MGVDHVPGPGSVQDDRPFSVVAGLRAAQGAVAGILVFDHRLQVEVAGQLDPGPHAERLAAFEGVPRAPALLRQRAAAQTQGARVINLASSAAFYGQADLAGYSASKFFVKGLTEALNIEWQTQGICVRDILPLFVQTAMVKGVDIGSIQRLGVNLQPEDVAAVIWRATQHPGYGKVHWPVGLQANFLYKLGAITPDWLNRAIARMIAM